MLKIMGLQEACLGDRSLIPAEFAPDEALGGLDGSIVIPAEGDESDWFCPNCRYVAWEMMIFCSRMVDFC